MDFLDEFADILKRMSVFAAPLIIVGDVNIHLDVPTIHSGRFNDILQDFDLIQHAEGANAYSRAHAWRSNHTQGVHYGR